MHRRLLIAGSFAGTLVILSQSLVIASGTLAGTAIPAGCTLTYVAAGKTLSAAGLAPASTTVARTAGVAVRADSATQNIVPGQTAYIPVTVTNMGNAADTIALSASSTRGWGVSFVYDLNADGVHQSTELTKITSTGSLAPDVSMKCFACVAVPVGATIGDTVTVTGTSVAVTSAYASAIVSCVLPATHTLTFSKLPTLSSSAVASGGTTNCTAIAVDSLGHQPTYGWSDGGAGGTFSPSALVQSPTYTARANPTSSNITVNLTCSATCNQGSSVTASATTPLTIQAAVPVASLPGDFNKDGALNSIDLSLFNKEWARWHQGVKPTFSDAIDAIYDLAPRVSGIWPNWSPVGDKIVNIDDATAFTECFTKSKNSTLAYTASAQTYRTSSLLLVTASTAPYGIYQVAVVLPAGAPFRATVDANGNLIRVAKGAKAGGLFYTEYDAARRTIKITGNVTGYAPYQVATIVLGY